MRPGFTLIELILCVVIVGILAAFGFSFFTYLTTTYFTARNERGIQQEGAYIVERIARELRDASVVTTGTGSASITLRHATPASGSTNATYSLSGGALTRNTLLIGQYVSSFSIDNPATNCYRVSLQTSRDTVTRSFQTTVCPRNLATGDPSSYKGNYYDTY
jgi:prepilin-type N-terminal cleavage/methylation domain-containing protein